MSWQENHREDGLWESVEETQEAIAKHISDRTLDSSDSRLHQLKALLSYLLAYRDEPHALITSAARKAVGTSLKEINAQLPNLDGLFKARSGQSTIIFNAFASRLRTWPQSGSVTLRGLAQQVERLENDLRAAHQIANDQIEKLESTSEEAIEAIHQQRQEQSAKYEKEIEALREEIKKLQGTLVDTRASIHEAESRLDDSVQKQRAVFEADQEDRGKAFSEQLENQVEEAKKAHFEAQTKADETLQDISIKYSEAESILGEMAQRSTATDYGQWAEKQQKTARNWSWVAVALFIITAAAFFESTFHFFSAPSTALDADDLWGEFFTRLGMTGVGLAGALYAAKESSQHKKEERMAKARELVLRTMDPFMANIDDDSRKLIRTEAARAIFVLRDEKEESKDNDSAMFDHLWQALRLRTKETKESENE